MSVLRITAFLAIWAIALWAELAPGGARAEAQTKPLPQVLVIAPDKSSAHAKALLRVIEAELAVQGTLAEMSDYHPLIDELYYDGFVYLGEDYFVPPSEPFLADMSRTRKPLLWIGYHAWLLPAGVRERTGLTVQDLHPDAYDTINYHGLAPVGGGDTSVATADHPARVFYWLYNADRTAAIPGAVLGDNLGYVSYLPVLDPEHPGYPAFRAVLAETMSPLPASRALPPQPEARLAAAKADTFRSAIHLPFVFAGDGEETIPYASDDYHRRLFNIKQSGADWVALSQTYFQHGISASDLQAHEVGTASFAALEHIADDAHRLGLFVQLSVIVNLDEETRKPNEWRGFIRPSDRQEWWRSYRKIVLDAARFADRAGIEALVIGAELNRMQGDAAQWRALAADVREQAQYAGLVGYQVNFDAFDNLTWADALDFLSIAAYWPLATTRDPSLTELLASWEKIGAGLTEWARDYPAVALEFGEIGYASQPYAAVFPFSWKPNRSRNLSHQEQLNLYLALEAFLKTRPDITGLGVFASTRYDRVPGDIGYSPFGKPAEAVVNRLMSLR